MTIRGIPKRAVRERLRAYSCEAGRGGPSRYLLLATGETFLVRDLCSIPKAWRKLLGSLRIGFPVVMRLTTEGAALRITNNARFIFARRGRAKNRITAKVALPSAQVSGSLAREIRARRIMGDRQSLHVPALRCYDARGLRWFEEDFIAKDKNVSKPETMRHFLTRHAAPLYAPTARSRPISRALRRFQVEPWELDRVLREAGATAPEPAAAATWPVAFLHGDLFVSNMIIDRKRRLFLIDWEKAHVGPVAWDLRIPSLDEPGLAIDALGSVSASGDMEPAAQLRLAFALELILFRRKHPKLLHYWTQRLGSREDAAMRMKQKETGLISRIADMTERALSETRPTE